MRTRHRGPPLHQHKHCEPTGIHERYSAQIQVDVVTVIGLSRSEQHLLELRMPVMSTAPSSATRTRKRSRHGCESQSCSARTCHFLSFRPMVVLGVKRPIARRRSVDAARSMRPT
jgi:hypothetical protein